MSGADRLSGLSDDLLASIISLLPTREAVRTTALSRQWRRVWLRTHSLILDSRSYGDRREDPYAYVGREDEGVRGSFSSDARQFLAAATGRCNHVRTLSVHLHGRDRKYFKHVMGSSRDLMASLLAAPALRYLEEVRVNFEVIKRAPYCGRAEKVSGWVYELDPVELPGRTLRVLDLDFCRLESPPSDTAAAAVSLPNLSSLRLYRCSSSTKDLEAWIRSAPSLGTLHIQDHNFYCSRSDNTHSNNDRFHLHSPSVTTFTLVPGSSTRQHFELNVPRLRAFRYNGKFQAFSLKSKTNELVRADLTLQQIYRNNESPVVQGWFTSFWHLLRDFRHAKAIKLKVPDIEGIAVHKDVQHEHLFTFPGLERLELRGFSDPGRKDDAALAIANLLQCCPVIHDLRIRIPTDPYYRIRYVDTSREVAVVSDFDASMDVFQRRFSKEMPPHLMLDRDDDDGSSQVGVLTPWLDWLPVLLPRRTFKNRDVAI